MLREDPLKVALSSEDSSGDIQMPIRKFCDNKVGEVERRGYGPLIGPKPSDDLSGDIRLRTYRFLGLLWVHLNVKSLFA